MGLFLCSALGYRVKTSEVSTGEEASCSDFRSFHEVVILRFQFGSFLCPTLGYGVKTSEVSAWLPTHRMPLGMLPEPVTVGHNTSLHNL